MNNSKNSILLVDPDFDPNTATDCDLLLKITADSFSYAVIDRNSRKLKAVFDKQECDDTIADLSKTLKRDNYLRIPFKEIKVSVYTKNTVAVPDALFNSAELEIYTNFFTAPASSTLYTSPFEQFGFTSVFSLEQYVEETLSTSLANAARFEHNAPLLALAAPVKGNALLLDFTAGSFNALLIENQKLIFQNSFQIENSEEFNYYLLLIIRELKLNASGCKILLSGIIDTESGFYKCLSKYFDDIQFNLPPASGMDQAILEDMPAHYYSSLLALDLCV